VYQVKEDDGSITRTSRLRFNLGAYPDEISQRQRSSGTHGVPKCYDGVIEIVGYIPLEQLKDFEMEQHEERERAAKLGGDRHRRVSLAPGVGRRASVATGGDQSGVPKTTIGRTASGESVSDTKSVNISRTASGASDNRSVGRPGSVASIGRSGSTASRTGVGEPEAAQVARSNTVEKAASSVTVEAGISSHAPNDLPAVQSSKGPPPTSLPAQATTISNAIPSGAGVVAAADEPALQESRQS